MLKNVAVLVLDGVEPFGLGLLCEVWGETHHPEDDTPTFDFAVCTPEPGRVRGPTGFDIHVEHGLERLREADLIAVVAKRDHTEVPQVVIDALREAHARGAIIHASCTATFTLAAAGLLDGRRCTTHWRYARELAARFPEITVDADVLYVSDGGVITGAGSAGGFDASLHLIREEFGAKVAGSFARRMVVPPHRDGGQAQFVRTPIGESVADTLEPLLGWASARLDQDLSVEILAAEAHMSPRTFARRFRDETGTTPHQWLTQQRLALAEELLEDTTLSVEQIAHKSGFGNSATLRHHFGQARNTTPHAYRKTFGCAAV